MIKEYLTVTIDTEADHISTCWAKKEPLQFNSILEGIPRNLIPIFKPFGVRPVYLLTDDVLLSKECVSLFLEMKGNCELGVHLHFSDIYKVPFEDGAYIEFEKLRKLTGMFKDSFGYTPICYRAGRFGIGRNTVHSLEKLGYQVDTSITPHINWKEINRSMDFRVAPEQPYIMDKEFILSPGKSNILEVPVSIIPRFLRKALWLRPTFASSRDMIGLIEFLRGRFRKNRLVVYNMMFHVMEIWKGTSPHSSTEEKVRTILDRMKRLFEFCSSEGIIYATLSEVRKVYI